MIRTALLLLSISLSQVTYADSRWPNIRSTSKNVIVADADDPAQASLEMKINSADGAPLYTVKCHSGDYDSKEHNYSGLMQCYLFSKYSVDRVENLFNDTYEQRRAWQNRGRFLAIHLLPGCSEYPEWGAIRHFKLRNMELTLAFSNIIFKPNPNDHEAPLAKSYKFQVMAKPVLNSSSEIAERTKSPEPPWFYSTACKKMKNTK